jgi:peptidoglycan/xylan/chitin deacetylase (PgdA/CDA1 family)
MMMAFSKTKAHILAFILLVWFSESTSQMLDILDEFNIPATFFLLGQSISSYPEVAQRIAASHTIASHTWSHDNLTWLSLDAVRDDLMRTSDVIEAVTGKRPRYFRPPYGYNRGH